MTALVTPAYVHNLTGVDVTDVSRVSFLITQASGLVMEYTGRTWTDADAPTSVQVAVSYLVADSLTDDPTTPPWMRAEQIGDYRAEYQDGSSMGMDVTRVAHLLTGATVRRSRVASLVTPVPFDGLVEEES